MIICSYRNNAKIAIPSDIHVFQDQWEYIHPQPQKYIVIQGKDIVEEYGISLPIHTVSLAKWNTDVIINEDYHRMELWQRSI